MHFDRERLQRAGLHRAGPDLQQFLAGHDGVERVLALVERNVSLHAPDPSDDGADENGNDPRVGDHKPRQVRLPWIAHQRRADQVHAEQHQPGDEPGRIVNVGLRDGCVETRLHDRPDDARTDQNCQKSHRKLQRTEKLQKIGQHAGLGRFLQWLVRNRFWFHAI